MLLIIPSIDIHHGSCRRCIEGAPGTESLYAEYSHHPERLVQLWRRENAKSLHITDFDAMFEHAPDANTELISSMIKATDIPIQLLSSFPDIEHCAFWLEQGLYRVIINEVLLTDPEGVKALVQQYTPSRVVAAIRVSSDRVTLPDMDCGLDVKEIINLAQSLGMNRIMYADTSWEGTLHGPDLDILKDIAQHSSMRITVGGGIGGPEQLWALQELRSFGIDSVVIGRALYENKFPCQEMWRSIEAKLEPDIS
ncbi:MAG: HisA/HisF-related TIM barrel protein [Candidatus Kapaibacteriota bacterium]